MNIRRIKEIEEILEDQLKQEIQTALLDHEIVWNAAEKLLDERLKEASIHMFPSAKGFTLNLCGTDLQCEYDGEIEAFVNDGYSLETLLEIKQSLNKWQNMIDKAIEEEEKT
jgi:hypothetical protein